MDVSIYICMSAAIVGCLILLLQRRYATACFAFSGTLAAIHYVLLGRVYFAIAGGGGLSNSSLVFGQLPSQTIEWGDINDPPTWMLHVWMNVSMLFLVAGAMIVIVRAIRHIISRRKSASDDSIASPSVRLG
jgi:hypothetical protein